MDFYLLLLLAVLLFIAAAQDILYIRITAAGRAEERAGSMQTIWMFSCIKTAWIVFCAAVGPPIIIFFMGIGALAIPISGEIYRGRYEARSRSMMAFLFYACLVLILAGCLALVKGQRVTEVMKSPYSRAVLLAGTSAVLCAISLMMKKLAYPEFDSEHDWRQDRVYRLFLTCCVGYVYCDAFFAFSVADVYVVSLLLIAGNLLLLLTLLLFLQQKWMIAAQYAREEEYERLSAGSDRGGIREERFQKAMEYDALTGCYSRRFITGELGALLRKRVPFSIALMDIDGLRAVNERQGREAGDRLLAGFSRSLRTCLREDDMLARVGGDEFLLVLRDCPEREAGERLESIRGKFSAGGADGMEIPFSFGIASGGPDVENAMQRADSALRFDKKHAGRGDA